MKPVVKPPKPKGKKPKNPHYGSSKKPINDGLTLHTIQNTPNSGSSITQPDPDVPNFYLIDVE
jgi:hypothetical protein